MTTTELYTPDRERFKRTGLDEAVFCYAKTVAHIQHIVADAIEVGECLLLTRLSEEKYLSLPSATRDALAFDADSLTAVLGPMPPTPATTPVAVITAGTSDLQVAGECLRTLSYHSVGSVAINDVGVAGLHRLLDRLPDIQAARVIIAIAGMDAALPTVLGGLVKQPIVAVPTSVGYGAAEQGRTALHALLASCAPGLAVVNIDNGYGAACAAIRIISGQSTG